MEPSAKELAISDSDINHVDEALVTPIDNEVTAPKRLPFAYAKRQGVLLNYIEDGIATISHKAAITTTTIAELRRYFGMPIKLQSLEDEVFNAELQQIYEHGSGDAMEAMGNLGEDMDLSRLAQELPEPEDLLESEDDAPIIRLLNVLLTEAIKENASDIHIETYENRLAIRFRVDGVLREVLEPKRALAPLLVSRIKVMAKLDIAEKRLPQDGRISLKIAGRPVDVRVSTLPSGHGERVVMRLLDKQAGRLDLEKLGMEPKVLATMDSIIKRPHGIMLVTGPTGSGKTTTLYAALSRVNDKRRNIMTIEDPIEYYIDGISQTHVSPKVDMTFARGLRAILRQDPDVVMIGEIRDLETAEIAVQASLTGHLVLSTLHTNTAVGAVTRMRDMGIEEFLLSSSLIGVLAQRLVRLLCSNCKSQTEFTEADYQLFSRNQDEALTHYHATGCSECNYTGYNGRTGIYELIEVDHTLSNMIHNSASEQELEAAARQKTPSIRDDGFRRVLSGETTIEEVLRVTRQG